MITSKDTYTVFSAVVPLYVAMILAYGSVRWWGILSPEQCGGINRFVSIFAVPLLSFQFISGNNPYEMNGKFVTADVVSKFFVLFCLGLWARYSKRGSFEWMITMFMLITLPNTLVMGTPLLTAMYGVHEGQLTTQAVVLQSAFWYTLLLTMYEYRAAKILIMQQFPENAEAIASFEVDSDVISLDGREPVFTEAEVGDNGRLHVKIHKSDLIYSSNSLSPRASNVTGAEIYSTHSSVNLTPRDSIGDSSFSQFYSTMAQRSLGHQRSNSDTSDVLSSCAPTPRFANFNEEVPKELRHAQTEPGLSLNINSSRFAPPTHRRGTSGGLFTPRSGLALGADPAGHGSFRAVGSPGTSPDSRNKFPGINAGAINILSSGVSKGQVANPMVSPGASENPRKVKDPLRVSSISTDIEDAAELQMFVWSANASPVSHPAGALHVFGGNHGHIPANLTHQALELEEVHILHTHSDRGASAGNPQTNDKYARVLSRQALSFGNRNALRVGDVEKDVPGIVNTSWTSSTTKLAPKLPEDDTNKRMPPSSVMIKLICVMTFRKLAYNPNTYSTILGVIWSLVAFRWNIEMPDIIHNSYHIISDTGLGMAMFSLGLFMGLGDRIIACGTKLALLGMFLRFLTSPALFAAAAYLVGLRGVSLKVSIVQAALPEGIVPFVFAKEYNVHPNILSTAVIVGMLLALPITLLYYVLLGL